MDIEKDLRSERYLLVQFESAVYQRTFKRYLLYHFEFCGVGKAVA